MADLVYVMNAARIDPSAPPALVAELLRLDEEWMSARRARSALFTVAALLSVCWWLRLQGIAWLPAHALDLGVALWGTVLAVGIDCRVQEWRLERRLQRLLADLQLRKEESG